MLYQKATICVVSLKPFKKKKVRKFRPKYLLDSQPNIDFFTREELKQVIRKFKTDVAQGNLEAVRKFYV
jgi:hypothetical protein